MVLPQTIIVLIVLTLVKQQHYSQVFGSWYDIDMSQIVTLLLVALSVGLGNFAAAVAIGLGGVDKSTRLRIAIVFGVFETGMPIIGLLLGQQVASELGDKAHIIGGVLLALTGCFLVYGALKKTDDTKVQQASDGLGKLLLAALSLSIDNLIIGFGLGTRHEPLLLAVFIIGSTSVALALIGLELGSRLSRKFEEYSELLGGLILISVGIAVGLKLI